MERPSSFVEKTLKNLKIRGNQVFAFKQRKLEIGSAAVDCLFILNACFFGEDAGPSKKWVYLLFNSDTFPQPCSEESKTRSFQADG